jgi:Leu/Phe-tRNA-protein transferase
VADGLSVRVYRVRQICLDNLFVSYTGGYFVWWPDNDKPIWTKVLSSSLFSQDMTFGIIVV